MFFYVILYDNVGDEIVVFFLGGKDLVTIQLTVLSISVTGACYEISSLFEVFFSEDGFFS